MVRPLPLPAIYTGVHVHAYVILFPDTCSHSYMTDSERISFVERQ